MRKEERGMSMRVKDHVVLGEDKPGKLVEITVDGKLVQAREGEQILAALIVHGIIINRYTVKRKEPRGLFCGIGQCTDCAMIVDGKPNVRTCVTPVRMGMAIETQHGVERKAEAVG
jgi:predicted molibdopterin-dependent oxidoreductase YjgC